VTKPVPPRTLRSRSSILPTRLALFVATACAALFAAPLAAQDTSAPPPPPDASQPPAPGAVAPPLVAPPPSLEDLIPDSAVENPEAWAQQGQPADAGVEPMAEVDPNSPLAEADVVRVTDELVLAFPIDPAAFPEREEFAERFGALSTIAELDSDEDNVAQLAARAKADQALLDTLLRVYGYYDAQVIRSVGGIQPADQVAENRAGVRFDVIPGPRYRFGTIDLGDLAQAPDGSALRQAFEIEPGDPMSSDTIVAEQFNLDTALGEFGYPFAAIDAPELLVDHARTEGDLTMLVHPGGKYVFGEVVSSMPKFLSGKHLATIARFDPGDTYQRSLEFDLRRAIVSTGLVSSVTIKPREVTPPTADAPGTVALDVEMTKAKLRTIAGAIGYGTGEGFRAEASWEHRNLFPPEGMLRVRGIAGTQEQLLGVTFRKNNFGGRDKVLTVDAFGSTVDSAAYNARTVSLIGTYERLSTLLFQKPLSWSIGLEAVATNERPKPLGGVVQPRKTYFIGAVPLYAMLDTSDNLLDPTKGFRAGLRLSPEVSRTDGMQSFYLRGQFDGSTYRRVTDTVVVAARVRVGSIVGTDLDAIAPSRRLYSGGGGSVRGYGYQRIGPRDASGNPTGGRSLVEGAIEARIKTGFFDGALSVVPFLDAGSVGQDSVPDFDTVRLGAGVGVRYDTGFGPLRFDIATPINPGPGDSRVAVYVSLGQAF
jgi:translocation and assembly module TamA